MEIVEFKKEHRDAVLELSLRAWEPVFPQLREAVPSFVYESFYPNGWRKRQLNDLAAVLDSEAESIAVALEIGKPVAWICTRFHPDDNMSEIYVLAVDPDYQRRGVGRALMEYSFQKGRDAGMRMAMVETGDDPGHAPGRRAYEAAGFLRWPVARYFKDLG